MRCRARRNPFGCRCGYVVVTIGHPYYLANYDQVELDKQPHGGITCACFGDRLTVANVAPEDWPIGFDCAHAWDYMPGMQALMRELGEAFRLPRDSEVYRTLDFVIAETNQLAEQLAAIAHKEIECHGN